MDSFLLGVAGKHPGTRSPGELLLVSRERLASRGLVGTEELSGFLHAGGSSLGERGEHCGGCTRNGGLGPGGHIVSVEHGNRLPIAQPDCASQSRWPTVDGSSVVSKRARTRRPLSWIHPGPAVSRIAIEILRDRPRAPLLMVLQPTHGGDGISARRTGAAG